MSFLLCAQLYRIRALHLDIFLGVHCFPRTPLYPIKRRRTTNLPIRKKLTNIPTIFFNLAKTSFLLHRTAPHTASTFCQSVVSVWFSNLSLCVCALCFVFCVGLGHERFDCAPNGRRSGGSVFWAENGSKAGGIDEKLLGRRVGVRGLRLHL